MSPPKHHQTWSFAVKSRTTKIPIPEKYCPKPKRTYSKPPGTSAPAKELKNVDDNRASPSIETICSPVHPQSDAHTAKLTNHLDRDPKGVDAHGKNLSKTSNSQARDRDDNRTTQDPFHRRTNLSSRLWPEKRSSITRPHFSKTHGVCPVSYLESYQADNRPKRVHPPVKRLSPAHSSSHKSVADGAGESSSGGQRPGVRSLKGVKPLAKVSENTEARKEPEELDDTLALTISAEEANSLFQDE